MGGSSRQQWAVLLLALAVLAFNSLWVSWHLGFVHKPRRIRETDHLHYIEMAKESAGRAELAQAPPYCYRVLTPWLAARLTGTGLDLPAAFYLITNASLLGFLIALDRVLAALAFAGPSRALGLLLAGLTQGPIRWFEYQYPMSDPPCLFLLTLALCLVLKERLLPLALVSVVAAFVRETYVLVYPCLLLSQWRRHGPRTAILRTALVSAVPLAILAALRLTITPNQPDDFVSSITDSVAFRWRHLLDNQPYVLTVGTWGVLLPLALLFPGRIPGAVRRHPELAALLVLAYGTLVISNNTERPLSYALPAVLPAALHGFERLVAEGRLPFGVMALVVLGLQAYLFAVTRFGEMGMSIYQPAHAGVAAAMAAFWVAGRATLLARARAAARAQ